MKKFRISAKVVSYVEREVKAVDTHEAHEILDHLLEMGDMYEVSGWTEEHTTEEIE